MNDRDLMQDMLLLEKGACDLYMHGTIESAGSGIHQTFRSALNSSLAMQDDIYQKMQQKGWYPTEQVEQTKIDTVKTKFENAQMQ
ncbi:MAG: spore coat protein [Ruminococcaceae bacterium]|nr:spore coat protein [Oscillospiraceae bacterium]